MGLILSCPPIGANAPVVAEREDRLLVYSTPHPLSPEAQRFFSRVGPVSFWGDPDTPVDFKALNEKLDQVEEALCLPTL